MQGNRRHWLALLAMSLLAPAAQAQYVTRPWPAGESRPALAGHGLDGRSWDLDALRGRPVLLNFWATWCGPCKQEMPSLQALAERQPGLVVLAVNVRERAPRVQRYLQQAGLRLNVVLDPFGELTRAWAVDVFPTTILVDAAGEPVRVVRGAVDWRGKVAHRWVTALMDDARP